VRVVSPAALSRWRQIVLVEDDSARAVRRRAAGVADHASTVLVRVHRVGRNGIRVAAERSYVPGLLRDYDAKQRSDLALGLLDGLSCRGSVVVCGPAYGSSSRFLDGLAARRLDAVVEVRPSSPVTIGRSPKARQPVVASDLLDRARWRSLVVPVAGVDSRSVTYAVARLGAGRLGSGPAGTLFAALTGGINGVQRGTLFGFSLADDATLEELIETVGWARWIRPLVRRVERPVAPQGVAPGERVLGTANGVTPRLRANITLSRRQDRADAAARLIAPQLPSFRGTLATASKPVNVVELFAGAGGMGLGFLLAGSGRSRYRLVYAGEVDPIYAQTLRSNRAALDGVLPGGARLTPTEIDPVDLRLKEALKEVECRAKEWGGADVLIGGPPCQGFSNANRNSWHSSNPHNELIDVFLSYVVRLAPRVFLLENVQGIHWTRKSGAPEARSSVLDHIRTRMAAAGYEVFVQLLDAVWFGVPQHRSRFFVLGIHRDLGYHADDFGPWGPFPQPSHGPGTSQDYVTVRDAIGDLPPVGNGHAFERIAYAEPTRATFSANSFLSLMRQGAEQGAVTDHVTSKHADYVIERYRKIPPGGNWESIADTLTNYADVNRTHSNIYRRLRWNEPSITIGHYRKSMLVHPSQHRGLSLREAARLQSFPDWFRFAGNVTGRPGGLVHKQQQLANAVCPLVTKAIAEFVLEL
jgi:DNA-cytosine methyltransferase